ncbi:MAG: cupin domain-containing protein [Candidatus Latescibacteria bacterium]|jgi:mannose-6-phosphate isomerase-like protein (cupin superfamily)|nr:cupin domain-containing protein [Candidatus Latescibacterota bacterium]
MLLSTVLLSLFLLFSHGIVPATGYAEQKDTPVFGHTDPSEYFEAKGAHKGAGSLYLMELLGSGTFKSNVLFLHRGVLPPKCGIGEHIHRRMEEVYFVFNAPAEFTVNGRTALLPAGTTVACPMGSSHGIYNNSDVTLEWMNIAVSKVKGEGDAIDYGDSLSTKKIESPAPFSWAQLDRSLLKPSTGSHQGKGTIYFRRLWQRDSFKTNLARIGHGILPPGTSIGLHKHNAVEEIYHVLSGKGRITVNDHTWDVAAGDAVPCPLYDSHGIYNNSNKDLEIIIIAIEMKKGIINPENLGDDLSDR